MKLSALAAVVALASIASAQQSGGASSAAAPAAAAAPAMMMLPAYLLSFITEVEHASIAHGTIMCLAFVIFFPAGSFVIRLGHFKGVVYVHAAIQMFAYILALAGMGVGAFLAHAPTKFGRPNQIHKYHPIIGVTIIVALVFQPILGSLHHRAFVRTQQRSIWSYLHVWWGRAVLTLAIIQGGLGLKFANNTTGGKIAYGVVAGIVWLCWLGVAIRHDLKQSQAPEIREKRAHSDDTSPGVEQEAAPV